MDIKTLDDSNAVRWDTYVNQHNKATFFHKSGWREVIKNTFGHPTYYLYAEEDGQIVGILPLGHIKSYLFGNALISTPFCVYGGIVSNNDTVNNELIKAASELAKDLKVDYLEYRNMEVVDKSYQYNPLYVTFRKKIAADHQENLLAIPRKQRAIVRKGIQSGLTSSLDLGVKRFYNVYAESVRNLGTPVFGIRLFEVLQNVFGDACEILSIEDNGRVVSSVMSFYFRDEVLPYYGGGITEARNIYANDFMYWEVMKRGVEKGCGIFDFGRSKKGTGSYRFKTHWGFVPAQLHYQYELDNSLEPPNLNPLNPKYSYFISLWKQLPLPISNLIGPHLSKYLG